VEFGLGADHPLFTAHPRLLVTPFAVYAWYLRVPDLAGFLLRIAPVLERRLAASPVAGYTGGLRLNFYTDGLRLEFDSGRLITAEPWREDGHDAAGASFPGLAFLQVLFVTARCTRSSTSSPTAAATTNGPRCSSMPASRRDRPPSGTSAETRSRLTPVPAR
jgi:hypothetical protein